MLAQPITKPEVAHLGMQPKKSSESGIESFRNGRVPERRDLEMSVAEQERMALEMLSRRV